MPLRLPALLALTVAPALAALSPAAQAAAPEPAAAPVRQVVASAPPYYESAPSLGVRPKVQVSAAYDGLLSSTSAADIRKARDQTAASPDMVSPLTMMVLAIRLYDIGERDEAVFWSYAARGRYAVLEKVLDTSSLTLAGLANGMERLDGTAGRTLYGYAYCDLAKEQATADQALQWTIAHPYAQLFAPQLPALDDDRGKAVAQAQATLRTQLADAQAAFANPARLAQMQEARRRDQADAKYCWK
jgi:hypothetical protein